MGQAVLAAIEELRCLNVSGLPRKYLEVFGEESKFSNKEFLFRRIAWRLRANAEGGLSELARYRVAHIVDDSNLRTRTPKEFLPAQVPVDGTASESHLALATPAARDSLRAHA